jgi:hypothetical protein
MLSILTIHPTFNKKMKITLRKNLNFIQISDLDHINVFFQDRVSSLKIRASSMQNKPNSPNVQMNLTFFKKMNYTISTSLTKVKNKPKQSQFLYNRLYLSQIEALKTIAIWTKAMSNFRQAECTIKKVRSRK